MNSLYWVGVSVIIIIVALLIFTGCRTSKKTTSRDDSEGGNINEPESNRLQLVPNRLTNCMNVVGFKNNTWNSAEFPVNIFEDNSKYTIIIGTTIPNKHLARMEIKTRAPTLQTVVSSEIMIRNENGKLTPTLNTLKERTRQSYNTPVKVATSDGNAKIKIKVNNTTNKTTIFLNNKKIFHFDEAFNYYNPYPMIVNLYNTTNFNLLQVCPH